MNAEITEGDTVAVSGCEYVYVRGNGDGTHVVKNGNGIEFDTLPGEEITVMRRVTRSGNDRLPSRDQFIAAEFGASRAAYLRKLEEAKASMIAIDLAPPVGVDKIALLRAKTRKSKEERRILLAVDIAEANLATFDRSADDTRRTLGAVWDNLKQRQCAVPAGAWRAVPDGGPWDDA